MKRLLLFLVFTIHYTLFNSAFSQCNVGWTRITTAGNPYASITLGSDSYIAAGDVITCTGAFSASSKSFCNEGTLNAGSFADASTSGANTNLAGGIINVTGTMSSTGGLTNDGTITVGGNMTIANALTNSGTINVTAGTFSKSFTSGDVVNNAGGNITISGNTIMEGVLTNSGYITVTGGTFTKTGTANAVTNNTSAWINISGNIRMEGVITNTAGVIESTAGTFTKVSTGQAINNISGGVIRAFGDISMEGEINNCGTIETTNVGKFTKTSTSGAITNSAGSSMIFRGSGITTRIEGDFTNNGIVKIEGAYLQSSSTAYYFTNSSTGYFRACENFTRLGPVTNSGTMEVLGIMDLGTSTAAILTNNAGAILNVTDDLLSTADMNISGCVTVGDQVWKKSNSGTDVFISSGTIYTVDFLQDNGVLRGGASAAARGFLRISGTSQTLNTVSLSGYMDIVDDGHIGVAPYLDAESPAYTYLTGNFTDNAFAPGCAQAAFAACGDALPAAGGACSAPPLPIELLFFTGQCNSAQASSGITLRWATASEVNNDFFTIERSIMAEHGILNWEVIETTRGAGNSSSQRDYEFTDYSAPKQKINNSGISSPIGPGNYIYYRLKQTDYDGQFVYSNILYVGCDKTNDFGFEAYPNPNDGSGVNISLKGTQGDNVLVVVYDVTGKKCFSKEIYTQKTDIIIFTIPSDKFAPGIYAITATWQQQFFSKKLIVK